MGSALRLPHSGRCVGPAHCWAKVVRREIVWRICRTTVLPDEKERYGSVTSVQSAELRLWVVRTRTTSRPDRLDRLRRAVLRRERGSGGAQFHENNAHAYTIDACVSKSSGSRCEVDGRVSRRSCARAHTVLRRTGTFATLQSGTCNPWIL